MIEARKTSVGGKDISTAGSCPLKGFFAEAVRDNTEFLVQPEEGVTVMRILDAIYESAASGKPVEL